MERQIDLTQQNVNCYDEVIIEDDGTLSFTWELWFDWDKYFGTNTADNEQDWINFYTIYNPETDRVTAEYTVDTEDPKNYFHDKWELTKDEENFLRKKMEEYVGCDLATYSRKVI